LESSIYNSEWNDTLENYFPEAYSVNDIQIYPDEAYIWIDWPSMTFIFDKLILDFDLQMWTHTEFGKQEHGACLASGKGKFVYSNGSIIEINDLEIDLSPQCIITPKYDNYSYCYNINAVIDRLKSAYPYPNNILLAYWAGVTVETIKNWQLPKARAKKGYVEQLMDMFNEQDNNIANILL
jgi:hypothetical protein